MVPKSIRLPILVPTAFGKEVIARAEKRLLQARILETKSTIKRLENEFFYALQSLESTLATDVFDVLLYANSAAANTQEQRQRSQEAKYRLLIDRRKGETATSSVHNQSSYKLDPAELSLLNKGLNFNTGSIPDVKSMTSAVELGIRKIDACLRDQARSQPSERFQSYGKKKTAHSHALSKKP